MGTDQRIPNVMCSLGRTTIDSTMTDRRIDHSRFNDDLEPLEGLEFLVGCQDILSSRRCHDELVASQYKQLFLPFLERRVDAPVVRDVPVWS